MKDIQKATLGGGCFWCVEAIIQRLKGVEKVISGYTGGTTKDPTYREVCNGNTGHAEVIQVTFNAEIITYDELLAVFIISTPFSNLTISSITFLMVRFFSERSTTSSARL